MLGKLNAQHTKTDYRRASPRYKQYRLAVVLRIDKPQCVQLMHSYARAQALNGIFEKQKNTLIYLRRTCFFDTGGIPTFPKFYVYSRSIPLNKKARCE